MKYELTTPAAGSPVTLDDAKAHLVVDHAHDDVLIQHYIDQATAFAEAETGQSIGTQVWTVYGDDWCSATSLPFKPVQSAVVKYTDTEGAEQTLAADQYYLDNKSYPARLYPAAGITWPDLGPGPNVVRVEVTTGHTAVKGTIESGIYMMIGHLYENREAVTAGAVVEVPLGARSMFGMERITLP